MVLGLNLLLLLFNRGETSLFHLFNWGMPVTSEVYPACPVKSESHFTGVGPGDRTGAYFTGAPPGKFNRALPFTCAQPACPMKCPFPFDFIGVIPAPPAQFIPLNVYPRSIPEDHLTGVLGPYLTGMESIFFSYSIGVEFPTSRDYSFGVRLITS